MSGIGVVWSVVAALVVGLAACGPATPDGRTPSPTPTAPPGAAATASPMTPTVGPTTPSPTTTRSGTAPPPPTSAPTVTPRPSRPSPSPTGTTVTPPPDPACTTASRYLGEDLEVIPTSRRVAALTFDGGASSTAVASILATLSRESVPATFFLTGDFAHDHPASARAIAAAHPVGNHTENHLDLTTLASTKVVDEVRAGAASIRTVTGRTPAPWFRFPFGARDDRTIRLVNEECYVAVRWSVDSLGWKGTSGGMTTAKVADRVLAAARPGMVVLMHVGANPDDGTTLDADALPAIIDGLQDRGYSFVSLPQVL